ncbi:MAG: amidohydrolase [Deltaproteobacteria bacterium]|nr:amidohydrolase [Deltaproteobacteria bacterium]
MNREELMKKVCRQIDQRREDMIRAAKTMLGHPELGYREVKTAAMVREVLKGLNLPVREGLALTGVEGTLSGKEAGPVVVVMGELDSVMGRESPLADPVTGAAHLCGHHIQVASMLGTAMGLVGAGVGPYLSGQVKFLGCPAEEYLEIEYRLGLMAEGKISFLGGKQELIKLGYFDDVAAAMMVHAFADTPEPGFLMNATGNGFMAKFIRYEGRPSHAGAAPHRGINALNAACIGIMAVHAQRETFQDDDAIRVHPIITKGGDVVNVVPADVRLETYVRGRNLDAILDASTKVDRAFKAGGDAVGAATKIANIPGYLPIFQDRSLTAIAVRNGRALLGDKGDQDAGFMGGSFDVGDLSHLIPVVHPFVTGTKGHLHSAEFCVTDYEAAVVLPAKLMAMCVIDLLADGAGEARRVKKEFKPRLTKQQYLDLMRRLTQ